MQIRMSFNSRRRAVPPVRLHHSLFYHTQSSQHTHKTSLKSSIIIRECLFHLHPSKFPVLSFAEEHTREAARDAPGGARFFDGFKPESTIQSFRWISVEDLERESRFLIFPRERFGFLEEARPDTFASRAFAHADG